MKRFIKNKKGFVSIYMILWMAVLIPILYFTFIDVSHYVYEKGHLKSVTDNASASAVTQIKEDLVPQGILEIDEASAEKVAMDILKHDLLLNDDLTPKENSVLKSKPTIQVNIVNITSESGFDFDTPAGKVKIYKPSVVIYAEYPVKGLFYYKSGVMMKTVGVSQVQFKSNH
ncbi:cobalt ABC transporter permease [Bacillus sp. M6-12]|uniref:TadE/TadG family type IV pilus assembly protein n=1 Tax=Bacillus sp. M6-12 TaxID=2054166 RepID=UPI000C786FBB|nr:cobalt ABC transporter permease [Bacillus sp. M6-12]PLS15027.1 cobalt ABC transporter permease [Bacillus sp. M6-12]